MNDELTYEQQVDRLVRKMRRSCLQELIRIGIHASGCVFLLALAVIRYLNHDNGWLVCAIGGVFLLAVTGLNYIGYRYLRLTLKSWENRER